MASNKLSDLYHSAEHFLADMPIAKAIGGVISNPTPQEFGAQVSNLGSSASDTLQDATKDPMNAVLNFAPMGMGTIIGKGAKAISKWDKPIWWDEYLQSGGKANKDGSIMVYHATTKEKAKQILKDGYLKSPAGTPDSYGVYFSSSKEAAKNYGDGTIIPIKVNPSDLRMDDVFPGTGRIDFMAKTKSNIYVPNKIMKAEDFLDK